MITATALVLFMTLPGLALFYAGLVRSRNVLSVLMQCFAIACMASVVWVLFGYSLFATDGAGLQAFIGGLGKTFLAGVGTDSVEGLRVAVQGVGHVGMNLCKLLHEAGAKLVISDVNRDHIKQTLDVVPATLIAPNELLFADVDVLAPCALGNILTSTTIPKIKAKVIAGAANNQLATPADGARLAERDILYAPDYVINAGGIINVAHEYYGGSSEDEVRTDIARIPERLEKIFNEAKTSKQPTNVIADELARRIVAAAGDNPPVAA